MTDIQFIEYANQVSRAGNHSLTELTKNKSAALVQFLMTNELKWNADVYKQISCIKFVVPHTTIPQYVEIHKYSTENQNLICLKGSISYRHEDVTWTSVPLFPRTADPYHYYSFDSGVVQTYELVFGIHNKPPLDSVVLHCQNVCDSLKVCLSNKEIKQLLCTWLASFMVSAETRTRQ